MNENAIKISAIIQADIKHVWESWNNPDSVKQWNTAMPSWHCPKAENDFTIGGKFSYTMAAKDGSFSFDFEGEYTNIIPHQQIAYTMADGRKVEIYFKSVPEGVEINERFEPENMNSLEMQKEGWQSILNNFKKYVENQ